jgi:hypothetical protein
MNIYIHVLIVYLYWSCKFNIYAYIYKYIHTLTYILIYMNIPRSIVTDIVVGNNCNFSNIQGHHVNIYLGTPPTNSITEYTILKKYIQ